MQLSKLSFLCLLSLILFSASCQDDTVAVVPEPEAGPDPREDYIVTTYAGTGARGYLDGPISEAQFSEYTISTDGAGNFYTVNFFNNSIRKITPDGIVSTLVRGNAQGYQDGLLSNARFNLITDVAVDTQGNLYVVDFNNYRIRKITPDGMVSTFAGKGCCDHADGIGEEAGFNGKLMGITIDALGNLYVIDNPRIRKITPDGVVSTVAGNGERGHADGVGAEATFFNMRGITVDKDNNLYVTDSHLIRKITPDGGVSTLAGSKFSGYLDGVGVEAHLNYPDGITVDEEGNLYFVESSGLVGGLNHIRKVSPDGEVSTVAGGLAGYADGPGHTAQFNGLNDIIIDATGSLFVMDIANYRIRKIVKK